MSFILVIAESENCKGKVRENTLGCLNGGYPDPKRNCRECRCQDGFAGAKCGKLAESGKKFRN